MIVDFLVQTGLGFLMFCAIAALFIGAASLGVCIADFTGRDK